jgi:CubicO group peptidase (beta-lactamase class C family)
VALVALAAHAAAPPPSPANARARALAQFSPTFPVRVFSGTTLPAAAVVVPPDLEAAFGPCTVKTTWYGPDRRLVKSADRPGAYGAVVDVIPKSAPLQRRFVTLYRVPAPVAAERRFGPSDLAALAEATGLPEAVVRRQADLVQQHLIGRPFAEWSRASAAARVLAGLSLSTAETGPVHKYDDALAFERQWWVDVKRRLYGWEREFNQPFVCPRPLEGKPALVVRAGALKEAGMKDGSLEKIDAVLGAFAADTDEAFAVCIVRHGVIVLHKAYGTRNGRPMTVSTKSWMASVTKTIAAMCMLMLIDQGLIDFDDPVEKFLPPLRGLRATRPLTVHHLYTHTNGLTTDGWPGWNDDMPDVAERLSAYYGRLRVGEEWAYTGTGNILGGKIIEAVTGEAMPRFYQKHLLGPLGCTGTDVTDTHAGAFSVPLDMAKFGQMLLNRGAYGDKRFFRPETFSKALPGKLDKLLGPGAKRTFGFGLDGSATRFGHGAASAATFHVDTERDLVVIMTRNRYGRNQDRYNGRFWEAINAGVVRRE